MAAVGVPFHTTTTTRSMDWSSSSSSCALPDGIPPAAAVPEFEHLADFLMLDHAEFAPSTFATDQYSPPPITVAPPVVDGSLGYLTTNSSGGAEGGSREAGSGGGGKSRIAFRTRSEVEILDDGFKWRKYGKKSVKNSPNPRNYYRCSTEGCSVKKRVERDKEDPSYVLTTYEGVHNHVSPAVVYYTSKDAVSGLFYVAGCQMPAPPAPASSSSC